jgi:hypothetical protein
LKRVSNNFLKFERDVAATTATFGFPDKHIERVEIGKMHAAVLSHGGVRVLLKVVQLPLAGVAVFSIQRILEQSMCATSFELRHFVVIFIGASGLRT